MKEAKRKIRNFRVSEAMDQRLKETAALIGTDPSTLLRDFVEDGTSLINNNVDLQKKLRQRYA